jgi:RNA polymerase sigma-70 factor (ECF subfamily)
MSLKGLSAQFMARRRSLLAYAYALVQDYASAEDLAQETYLEMADACEKGTEIGDLGAWCRSVVRHKVFRVWREQKRGRCVLVPDLAERLADAFEEHAAEVDSWEQKSRALSRCLDKLQAKHRKVIDQKYLGGLSAERIAEQMHSTRAAVYALLARLRRTLQACIASSTGEV